MRNLKATLPTLMVMMLVFASAPMTSATEPTLKTEWLSYAGTNLGGESTSEIIDPIGLAEPCDEQGVGGVRFCQALNGDHMPSDVAIEVRDAVGLPVGFYYKFLDANGDIIHDAYTCRQVNTAVPSNELSPNPKPDSVALVVRPALEETLIGPDPTLTVPSVPLGVADTINDATPEDAPELPNETPQVSTQHPFPCGSPTGANGQVVVTWRY